MQPAACSSLLTRRLVLAPATSALTRIAACRISSRALLTETSYLRCAQITGIEAPRYRVASSAVPSSELVVLMTPGDEEERW